MIVKMFRYGKGNGSSVIDYLLGKNRDREQSKILKGNESNTLSLINNTPFIKNIRQAVYLLKKIILMNI